MISQLSAEGYKIGAIKHIHRENFTIDKEGTNTWRYAKAGSKVVVAVSPEEIAVIKKTNAELNDLDEIIKSLDKEQLDLVFIEGFHGQIAKRSDIPKIVTAKDEDNLKQTLAETAEPILAVTGVISSSKPHVAGLKIPILNLEKDGTQLLNLVKACLKKKA